MKLFLRKLGVFIILSIAFLIVLALVPRYIIKNKASFRLKESNKIAVFGHSHPECAFRDSIIPDLKNFAQSGESYFYTYQKIKKVIEENPEIKVAIIEFSNNQIDKIKMDKWIWGYEKMVHFFPPYSPFINKEDFNLLLKNNSKDIFPCISVATKKNIYRIINSDYDYSDEIGGFNWIDNNELEFDNEFTQIDENNLENEQFSEIHLNYLRKIIDHCQDKNVKVFLTRSPQHQYYSFQGNEPLFQKIRNDKFSDVDFLDFNDFPMPDEYFADLGHLNYKGAEIFSNAIATLLENGLLESEKKAEMINEYVQTH